MEDFIYFLNKYGMKLKVLKIEYLNLRLNNEINSLEELKMLENLTIESCKQVEMTDSLICWTSAETR